MNNYKYLKNIFDSIYANKLTEREFIIWFNNDFKNFKSKKQLIKAFTNYKKDIVDSKLNTINEMIGSKKQYKTLLAKIKTYYNNINKQNVFEISDLAKKLKQYDNYINYLDGITFKYEMNNTINQLKMTKKQISNKKYFNLFDKEVEQINRLINILERPSIQNNFNNIEQDLTLVSKKLMHNIKEKANKYNNNQIINTPVRPEREYNEDNIIRPFNEEVKEEKQTEILKQDENVVVMKQNDNLIVIEQNNNKVNYKVINYSKMEEEQKIRKQRVDEEYNDLKQHNQKLTNPVLFFDYCKLGVYRNQELSEEQIEETVKYIDVLKNEFLYLFSTTLNPNDEKKIIEMLLNTEAIIERKIASYTKGIQKVKIAA